MEQTEQDKLNKILLEQTIDPITLIDSEGVVLYQSPSAFGWDPEEIVGQRIFDFVHPDDLELTIAAFSGILLNEATDRIVVRFRNKSGKWNRVETLARTFDRNGEQNLILNTRHVDDIQTMLDQLKTSEKLKQAAFNSTGTICSITDLQSGEFVDVNDAWVEQTGWSREEALGHTAIELNIWGSDKNRERVTSELRKNTRLRGFPATFKTKTGEIHSILVDAEIISIDNKDIFFLAGVDTTEREQMEAQLRQAQRLESVGQLTGGIAHDLNNMLTVVLGQIDLSTNRNTTGEMDEALAIIRRATERGSDLIKQLMIFSRRQTLKPSSIDTTKTIQNMLTILDSSLGGEVAISTHIDEDVWNTYLDESLLENAILNLALNSRDAMPNGGTLAINAENYTANELNARRYEITEGGYVKLEIVDTGRGMDAGTIENAFEPFFTTKPMGQGTGLGLSMVFGFVKQSGGHIEIASEPGIGTNITMFLPSSSARENSVLEREQPTHQLEGKSVLLIEDNEELRNVLKLLLESFGCRVIECTGELLEPINERIDLILSDVILPGRSQGPDLVKEVLKTHPDAKVLFMSGYPRDRLTGDSLVDDQELLKKPFSKLELQEKLNQTLTSGG
jgi:PAS domain S-box-containing protein